MFDLVIKNARVAQPDGSIVNADLACKNGRIDAGAGRRRGEGDGHARLGTDVRDDRPDRPDN